MDQNGPAGISFFATAIDQMSVAKELVTSRVCEGRGLGLRLSLSEAWAAVHRCVAWAAAMYCANRVLRAHGCAAARAELARLFAMQVVHTHTHPYTHAHACAHTITQKCARAHIRTHTQEFPDGTKLCSGSKQLC